MDRRTPTGLDEANQLYWSSDKGVNQLADELGVSKGMLYAAIQPKPSGFSCGDCGDQLVYPNRTALERSMLNCPSCGNEIPEAEAKVQLWEGSAKPVLNPLSISDTGPGDRPLRIDLLRERKGAEPHEPPFAEVGSELEDAADALEAQDVLGVTPHESLSEATALDGIPSGPASTRSLLGAAALCVGLGVLIGRRWR